MRERVEEGRRGLRGGQLGGVGFVGVVVVGVSLILFLFLGGCWGLEGIFFLVLLLCMCIGDELIMTGIGKLMRLYNV